MKVAFARIGMVFNCDIGISVSDFLNQTDDFSDQYEQKNLLDFVSGSFSMISIIEDFQSGSRLNFTSNNTTWTKQFLFTGSDFLRFFPNFNPKFSPLCSNEITSQRELTDDCVSFSGRFQLPNNLAAVGAVSWQSHMLDPFCCSGGLTYTWPSLGLEGVNVISGRCYW